MPIKYEFALRDDSNIVHISDAIRGPEYCCLDCKSQMIPKLGTIKQHHFSHKSNACGVNEGPLHYNFKILLYNILKSNLSENKPFVLEFICNNGISTDLDLLENITDVKLEHFVCSKYKPDITLIGEGVIKIIEVVVTHNIGSVGCRYIHKNKTLTVVISITEELYAWLLSSMQRNIEYKLRAGMYTNVCVMNYDATLKCAPCWLKPVYGKIKNAFGDVIYLTGYGVTVISSKYGHINTPNPRTFRTAKHAVSWIKSRHYLRGIKHIFVKGL